MDSGNAYFRDYSGGELFGTRYYYPNLAYNYENGEVLDEKTAAKGAKPVSAMLALVRNWNVDLKLPDSIVEMEKAQQVNEEGIDKEKVSKQGFSEMGTVYKDPETGKMYMITIEDQKNGSSGE